MSKTNPLHAPKPASHPWKRRQWPSLRASTFYRVTGKGAKTVVTVGYSPGAKP